MDNKKWFKEEAKFGMMVHFGLYSLLAGEYRGKRIPHIGEWIQSMYRIPNAEYEKLAKIFNPIYFDAEEWVLTAKAAGMNYMVVTSKHHEGFCLFDSAYDNYNCVKGSPFGRDIIGELAEACRKHGMKLGLYYSQSLTGTSRTAAATREVTTTAVRWHGQTTGISPTTHTRISSSASEPK